MGAPVTTDLDRTAYHAEWSPDGTKLLFGDKDLRLFVVDVATKKRTKIAESRQLANDEFSWEISDYAWSPDGAWVAYTQIEPNRNGRIWLHELATGKTVPVTDGFYHSVNPSFDPKGELLYFLSYRSFTTRVDVFEDNHVIPKPVMPVAVQLRAGQKPPFEKAPKDEAKSAEPAPDGAKIGAKDAKEAKGAKDAPKPSALPKVVVDVEGLSSRLFPLPVKAGTYFHLKAGKGFVTWGATEEYGEDEIEQLFSPAFGKDLLGLRVFDVAAQKEVALEGTDLRLAPLPERRAGRREEGLRVPRRRRSRSSSRRRRSARRSPSTASSSASTRATSGCRSSTTPGAGTATSSTTRTCTAATGRRWARPTGRWSPSSARGAS